DAEKVFRRLLEKDKASTQALNGIATCLFRQGDFPGALRYYAQAFDANPGDLAPIRSLMNMYAEAGRLLGALAAAGLARDLPQPDEAKVALDVAMLHL